MKSESNIYDHQSSRSLNLDIPNPRKIEEHIAAQTRGLTSSHYFILSLLGCGGVTIFPSLLGPAIRAKSLTFELLICVAKVKSLCEGSEAFRLLITDLY